MKTKKWFALILTLLITLTACGKIPTSGSVGRSDSGNTGGGTSNYSFNPESPSQDATAAEIVLGFIRAGTGPSEDYKVAREYLTGDSAATWNPVAETLVYNGEPSLTPGSEPGQYLVQVELAASIDDQGIMTPAPPNTTRAIEIEVTEENGQYRIVSTPDGTIVHANQFQVLFSSHNLYFYDATFSYLVPDVRWFVNRTGFAAAVVDALLNGPAPYLRSAVFSAFPDGSELTRSAVPTNNGRAMVDFETTVMADADSATRRLMHTQLLTTLDQLTSIQDVVMTTEQRDVEIGQRGPDEPEISINPSVGSTQIAINEGALVYFEGSSAVPIGSMPDISALEPRFPAMNQRGTSFAFLDGSRTQLHTINESRSQSNPISGSELTWPSYDSAGWVWTVNNAETNAEVMTYAPDQAESNVHTIDASWLANEHVVALRISADGARAALIVGDTEESHRVLIAGVIRDSEGVPRGLTEPVEMPVEQPVNVVTWVDESKIAVVNAGTEDRVTAQILGLDYHTESLRPLLGLTNLSTGTGENTIYAETEDAVYLRVGSSWRAQDSDVDDLNYPG